MRENLWTLALLLVMAGGITLAAWYLGLPASTYRADPWHALF